MLKLQNTDGYDVFINPSEISSCQNGVHVINHSNCSTIFMKSGEYHFINKRIEEYAHLIKLGKNIGGVVNKETLMKLAPIKDMHEKQLAHGLSFGLSHAGYDIRLKQNIAFNPRDTFIVGFNQETHASTICWEGNKPITENENIGRFTLASAIEEFQMPPNLVGIVHDKSSLARKGIQVFNTVIEPNWKGFLTLELVFNGEEEIVLEAGTPIAQVIFHSLTEESFYDGKYQNQEDRPVEAKEEQ